jgi:hypothetical protein
MEFARSSAVTQRTEYVVIFDSEQQEYWLSLLEFLDQGSGNVITDSSRTSLADSLAALEELNEESAENADEDTEEYESTYSRTGGILGIPKELPASIDIIQTASLRTEDGGSGGTDYIIFYPDGTAEDFEIYLQSQSGKILLVSVAQATGRAGIRQLTDEEINELGLDAALDTNE